MITPRQVAALQAAHADGLTDAGIAERAGVSISTVKRYRQRLALETRFVPACRGRLGERIVAERAELRGFKVEWRERDGAPYDLLIEGCRVDAKTSMQLSDGTWKFRLHEARGSFHGRYEYRKCYARDCEVVVFVCLYPDERPATLYLMESLGLPSTIRIRPGRTCDIAREDWSCLPFPSGLPMAA